MDRYNAYLGCWARTGSWSCLLLDPPELGFVNLGERFGAAESGNRSGSNPSTIPRRQPSTAQGVLQKPTAFSALDERSAGRSKRSKRWTMNWPAGN